MMKFAALLALAAVCSAEIASYSYSAMTPYSYGYGAIPYSYGYGAIPYNYGAVPYSYGAYAPLAQSVVAAAPLAKSYIAAPAVIAPALVKTQYHAQDPLSGSAAYGHIEAGQAHQAVQDAAGNKVGSFSHILPDGSVSRTDYVADALGYRVASNSLPINVAAVPLPVSDTPEVVAARAAHLAEVDAVKSRSKRAIAYTGAYTAPLAYSSAPLAYSSAYTAAPLAYSSAYTPALYAGSAYYNTPAVAAYSKLPYYY